MFNKGDKRYRADEAINGVVLPAKIKRWCRNRGRIRDDIFVKECLKQRFQLNGF
jgi:hypothetical protein